jgi:hypothetical protein
MFSASGIVVFSLVFALRDSAKLSISYEMLEPSFLGYVQGSKASICIQRTGASAEKEVIYRDGGWENSNRSNRPKRHRNSDR